MMMIQTKLIGHQLTDPVPGSGKDEPT